MNTAQVSIDIEDSSMLVTPNQKEVSDKKTAFDYFREVCHIAIQEMEKAVTMHDMETATILRSQLQLVQRLLEGPIIRILQDCEVFFAPPKRPPPKDVYYRRPINIRKLEHDLRPLLMTIGSCLYCLQEKFQCPTQGLDFALFNGFQESGPKRGGIPGRGQIFINAYPFLKDPRKHLEDLLEKLSTSETLPSHEIQAIHRELMTCFHIWIQIWKDIHSENPDVANGVFARSFQETYLLVSNALTT